MAKQAETISKSEAVRQTIQAGIDNPTEGVKHVKEKYGLDVTAQVFSTIKSLAKRKKKGKRKPAASVAATSTRRKASNNGHMGNPADLARSVKALVAAHGADAIKDMVEVFAL